MSKSEDQEMIFKSLLRAAENVFEHVNVELMLSGAWVVRPTKGFNTAIKRLADEVYKNGGRSPCFIKVKEPVS